MGPVLAYLSLPFPLCLLSSIDLLADVSGLRQNFATLLGTSLTRLVGKPTRNQFTGEEFFHMLQSLVSFVVNHVALIKKSFLMGLTSVP